MRIIVTSNVFKPFVAHALSRHSLGRHGGWLLDAASFARASRRGGMGPALNAGEPASERARAPRNKIGGNLEPPDRRDRREAARSARSASRPFQLLSWAGLL